jgi:hypothetical protein
MPSIFFGDPTPPNGYTCTIVAGLVVIKKFQNNERPFANSTAQFPGSTRR